MQHSTVESVFVSVHYCHISIVHTFLIDSLEQNDNSSTKNYSIVSLSKVQPSIHFDSTDYFERSREMQNIFIN